MTTTDTDKPRLRPGRRVETPRLVRKPRPQSRPPSPPAGPWRLITLALAALLVATAVAATVATWRWQDQRGLEQGRQEALAAATQAAVNFVSVSVSTVDRDMQRIIDGSTGTFREEYEANKATFRAQIIDNRAESSGSVLRAGVLSSDVDSAVVLVALDATIRNVSTPAGRLSHYRMRLDLARDAGSGRWLVSALDFVG